MQWRLEQEIPARALPELNKPHISKKNTGQSIIPRLNNFCYGESINGYDDL
jgi:hypothetical protein